MKTLRKITAALIVYQLFSFTAFARPQSAAFEKINKDLDVALEKMADHDVYHVDNNGNRIDNSRDLLAQKDGTIRIVRKDEDTGESYGLLVKVGDINPKDNTLKLKIAVTDDKFRENISARSVVLDLNQNPVKIHSRLTETLNTLHLEVKERFSPSFASNILSSIGELFFPAAHAKVSDSVKITMIIAFVIIVIALVKYEPVIMLILASMGVLGIGLGLILGCNGGYLRCPPSLPR